MTEITFRSDMLVDPVDSMGSDVGIARAARVSTGTDNNTEGIDGLINFLMANRHGTPFEHGSMTFRISAPIFVWREFMRHRIGFCLPGSARIAVGTHKNGQTKAIADVYRDWKIGVPDSMGRTRLLPSTRHLMARCLNEETGLIQQARMVDVYQSGEKDIVRIETTSGRALRCTPEHQVWTPDGWTKAADLRPGDAIARQGKVAVGERLGIPKRLREGIQIWTTEMKRHLVRPVDQCWECGRFFSFSQIQMDHIVPVSRDISQALNVGNLRALCGPCHQAKTNTEGAVYGEGRRTLANGARFEAVVSIRPDGREMTYDIEMPAPWHSFVADDFIVHNSYNEESGRYKQLDPVFYVPAPERNLVQVGKAGKYEFVPGDDHQYTMMNAGITYASIQAYEMYEALLERGIAREVARMCLPVNIFSAAYVTCNPRSLMAFLSLRTKREDSAFPSFPQREIEMVAEKMEDIFSELFPITHASFDKNGRVAP